MIRKYELPLSEAISDLICGISSEETSPASIDENFEKLTYLIKKHDKQIPRTRYKKNIKPYWCEELNSLKRIKVDAFKAWCSAGRPREVNNPFYIRNKDAKRNFRKRIKHLSKEYDEKKISDAIKSAEIDRSIFWKMLKRERDGPRVKTPSIKNDQGKIVYKLDEILNVWEKHFSSLGTPINSPNFDKVHYDDVTKKVQFWMKETDVDVFCSYPISLEEVEKGINTLNSGKTPGIDGITKEHLKYAGVKMAEILCLLFNQIVTNEYIPINFRRGVQIPLYKGKNTPIVEVNNYRGITLLSTFNKLFEIILWKRMETWWGETGVLSQLQGACRKGVSCVHTAMLLQETISSLLQDGKKVFVTYLDVSKAFDGVWIDGLFYRLRQVGVRGRTWRLLYKTYIDFKCRARVQGEMSNWYTLRCGIHQGGYLSLMKYLAFINSLISGLEDSNLCCMLGTISISPLGYADDIAAASTSKNKTDRILEMVFKHSCKWRYKFNPKKSAVLVYGEGKNEQKQNAALRVYRLGSEPIKEQTKYEHLGLVNYVNESENDRTLQKIKKGRKALNAAAGIGLKPGGLTISACSILFWAMVVPIITFASELWVINDNDVKLLEEFQRYAGRRIQRFPYSSPNETSYVSLGWIRLEIFIYVKKVLFIRSIAILPVTSIYRKIFVMRMYQYDADKRLASENRFLSPVFDIIRIADLFGLYKVVKEMMEGVRLYSKCQWKEMVWRRAWDIERQDWQMRTSLFKATKTIKTVSDTGKLLIWWQLAGIAPEIMRQCEVMVKIVCKSSNLKVDSHIFRNDPVRRTYCELCNDFSIEDARHVILHCPLLSTYRTELFEGISLIETEYNSKIVGTNEDLLSIILGQSIVNVNIEAYTAFLKLVARSVYKMYTHITNARKGIG